MGLILSTAFNRGSLIEEVSGKPFDLYGTAPYFGRVDGLISLNSRTTFCGINNFKINQNSLSLSFAMNGFGTRTAPSNPTGPFGNEETAGFYLMPYLTSAGGIVFYYTSNTNTQVSASFNTSKTLVYGKTHWLFILSNKVITLYANGILYQSVVIANSKITEQVYPRIYVGNNSSISYDNRPSFTKFVRVYNHVLTPDEISAEYQYFLNLKSPQKKVYLPYTPKPNKIRDGLVANYTKAVGQTMINNLGTTNLVRSVFNPGFIDNDGTELIKLKPRTSMQNTGGVSCGKNYSLFFRFSNGGSVNIEGFIHNYLGYYIINTNVTYYQISTSFDNTKEHTLCIIVSDKDKIVKTYLNGILNYTRTIPNVDIMSNGGATLFYSNSSWSIIKDLSYYNTVKTAADALAYHKQFERVTLYEDFSNYAVGQTYGEPYRTNARPVVAELTSAAYGYPKGKKYLANSTSDRLAWIQQTNAYGKWIVKMRVINNVSASPYIGFIANRRTGAQADVNQGYTLILSYNKSISLSSNGSVISTATNAFNLNELIVIEITRDINNLFIVKVNDKQIISIVNATYTTSQNMLLHSTYADIFEIKHTSL